MTSHAVPATRQPARYGDFRVYGKDTEVLSYPERRVLKSNAKPLFLGKMVEKCP